MAKDKMPPKIAAKIADSKAKKAAPGKSAMPGKKMGGKGKKAGKAAC